LTQPVLYLSLYFKAHRQEYYDWLQKVRSDGDWEGWLKFFLTGVMETSDQATQSARLILRLFETDCKQIERFGKATGTTLRTHQLMQAKPLLSIPSAAKALELTVPTVTQSFHVLQQLGIVREITGRKRGRLFAYSEYLNILNQGTEPL
jgi:Fic family protein